MNQIFFEINFEALTIFVGRLLFTSDHACAFLCDHPGGDQEKETSITAMGVSMRASKNNSQRARFLSLQMTSDQYPEL